ncbi:MAG: alpha-ketoacid dehydrogenase subunit beta [Ktedonobacterales bacterium]|nr:alpha-ketoacid dehydrogenase subunit beta [Ktedonobacterales bacterium]
MPEQSMIAALRAGLREEMARDARVVLLGEDIGAAGGIFNATQGLRREFGEARVWDMPLAEGAIVGISIGAAMGGLRPVAEIGFADYLLGAMHQIVNEAAKLRYRSGGEWTCPIVIRAPYGGGGGGPDHTQNVEAFFAHVPGLKVVIPSSPADMKGLIKAAIRDGDPVIFLEPKRIYHDPVGEVPDAEYIVPLGVASVCRAGTDASVITYGAMVKESLAAAEVLAAEDGIQVEVVDVRTLQPLDFATIATSVHKTTRAVVFHEAVRFAGFGAEIAAFIAETCFDDLASPVLRVGARSLPTPAAPELERAVLPHAATLIDAVRHLVAY